MTFRVLWFSRHTHFVLLQAKALSPKAVRDGANKLSGRGG